MHIYIHVPFCARRCSYCDFAIAVRKETPDGQFVAAIEREWGGWLARSPAAADGLVDTLYFGGGTPSRLQPATIERLVGLVRTGRSLAADAEVTLEANPDDVTDARAAGWRRAGINRVSLGVQSHDPSALAWMHRTHRVEQVRGAVDALRAAGIDNISIDLIFALPTALQRNWAADLEHTFALQPAHISLYGLTVEPQTPLARWTARGTTVAAPDERYAEEYLEAHRRITAAGFDHYEVSNAGRPGFRSRHNSAYWSGVDYLGMGPSAHSLEGGERRWNVAAWAEYQARSARGASVIAGAEALGAGARDLEHCYLSLRTTAGLGAAELAVTTRESWVQAGWAIVAGDRVRLTPEGWLRLDALVATARHS